MGYFLGSIIEDQTSISPQDRRIQNVCWAYPTLDGTKLVSYQRQSVGLRFKVKFYEAASGKALGPPLGTSTLNSTISGDGKTFAALDKDGFRAWSVLTGEPRPKREVEIGKLYLNHNGERFLTLAQEGKTVHWKVYDTGSGTLLQKGEIGARDFRGAQLSGDGRTIAISNRNKTTLLDVDNRGTAAIIEGGQVSTTGQGNQGRWFSRDQSNGQMRLYGFKSGKPMSPVLNHPKPAYFMGCDQSGRKIVTACTDRKARVWDRETGELLFQVKGWGATISSDGTLLTVTAYPKKNKSVTTIYRLETGRKERVIHSAPAALQIASNHNARGGYVWLFDREDLLAVPYKH